MKQTKKTFEFDYEEGKNKALAQLKTCKLFLGLVNPINLQRRLNYWIKNTCSFTGKSKSVIHGPSSISAFKPVAFFGTVKTNTVPID
jgi:hypothetical protein